MEKYRTVPRQPSNTGAPSLQERNPSLVNDLKDAPVTPTRKNNTGVSSSIHAISMSGRAGKEAPVTPSQDQDIKLILELKHIFVPEHFGTLCKLFGFPDEIIVTGKGLKQDNWTRQGLYINYQYTDRHNGIADLLVVITTTRTKEQYLKVLSKIKHIQPQRLLRR